MRNLALGTGILLGLAAWSPAQDLSESVEFSHRFGGGNAVGNAVIELSSGGYTRRSGWGRPSECSQARTPDGGMVLAGGSSQFGLLKVRP